MRALQLWVALLFSLCVSRQSSGQDTSTWHESFPPHRIADNLYYVGSRGLASYLITTPEGHILINACFERTVPLIRASIEKLGFQMSDVKVILSSHAHGDHVEGQGLLQQLSGARIFAMRGDAEVMRQAGAGQYLYDDHWTPCRVDRVLKDGEEVTLGNATLVAHLTPGHTRGCTTWTMVAKDHGESRNVVIVGSPNVNPGYRLVDNRAYPEISSDYARGFKTLKSLPCDIFLGAHGNYYGMESKYAKLKAETAESDSSNPFVDPDGYRAFIEDREKAYLNVLKEQQREKENAK